MNLINKQDLALYTRLLGYFWPYRAIFLLSILSMVLMAATAPLIPVLTRPMMNGAFIEQQENTLLLPILFICLFTARAVFSYISVISLVWTGERVVADLRSQMFTRLMATPSKYFDENARGKLISCFTFNATQVSSAVTLVLQILVRDSLVIIGLVGWLIYMNVALAIVCLVSTPFIVAVIMLIKQRLRKLSAQIQASMGNLHHGLDQHLSAEKLIKISRRQAIESDRFSQLADNQRRLSMKSSIVSSASSPLIQMITSVVIAVVVYIATWQAASGTLTVGDFVAFFTAIALLPQPLRRFASVHEHIQKGLAACESIFAIIDLQPEPDSGIRILQRAKGQIQFHNVCYCYTEDADLALDSVSINIEAGQTVALVGQSGGGKTTLTNLIMRFYIPTSGRIEIDGINLLEFTLDSVRENIAHVSQDVFLFNDTVAANIVYGVSPDLVSTKQLWEVAEAASADEFIRVLPNGMETFVGEGGLQLSSGQRQRISIARALLKNTPILILDEATSALDAHSEKYIQEALDRLRKDRTCIIIAHRLSTVKSVDKVVVLEQGKVIEEGVHDMLLEKSGGAYQQLYYTQFNQ